LTSALTISGSGPLTSTASSTSEPSITDRPRPLDAENLRDRVDATLADFLAKQARTLTSVSPD
jgi:hypothetical protein